MKEAGKPGKPGRPEKPGRGGKPRDELELQLEGQPRLGAEVPFIVTYEGSPVEGATVTISGEEVETKIAVNGRLTIELPDTPGEVKIEATFGDKSSELEIELEEQEGQPE